MNSTINLVFQKNNIGLGKRKQAVARVFLVAGEGNLIINKLPGCLLYTSPSPRDRQKARMPSSA